jgi:hypothetical protein
MARGILAQPVPGWMRGANREKVHSYEVTWLTEAQMWYIEDSDDSLRARSSGPRWAP